MGTFFNGQFLCQNVIDLLSGRLQSYSPPAVGPLCAVPYISSDNNKQTYSSYCWYCMIWNILRPLPKYSCDVRGSQYLWKLFANKHIACRFFANVGVRLANPSFINQFKIYSARSGKCITFVRFINICRCTKLFLIFSHILRSLMLQQV